MFSLSNSHLPHCSFLMRLLRTTGLSLALMTASPAGVHAEDVTVQGANGANGADGVNPGDEGQPGVGGGYANANASSADPLNSAMAIGGDGGAGGNGGPPLAVDGFPFFEGTPGGNGGTGGGAGAYATAATTAISSSVGADADASGGTGGFYGKPQGFPPYFANGGSGGAATAVATGQSVNGNATASASATGGDGVAGDDRGGSGGEASASSTASANGSGGASSFANATGGAGALSLDSGNAPGGNAIATAYASAAGGGNATATAVATEGSSINSGDVTAEAISNAETTNGAMAQALSTAELAPGSFNSGASDFSTAKTSFAGVKTTATMETSSDEGNGRGMETADAIAQGGSAQFFGQAFDINISVARPDKAYATSLIGGASNVADALLGPQAEIFGAAILSPFEGGATFDFSFQGDLVLGVIDDYGFEPGFDITVNGIKFYIGDPGDDAVINLGSFGPNVDVAISGSGIFVLGGAVPEPSTWAMMLLGSAGLGFAGYRQTRRPKPQAA